MQLDKLADQVALVLKAALAPIQERLATAEQVNRELKTSLDAFIGLRDRVVAVETKAAQPVPVQLAQQMVDLAPVLERVAAAEARLSVLGDLRDRVVTVETKAALQVMPEPVTFDAAPLLTRIADLEQRLLVAETKAAMPIDLGSLEDRVLSVEHRTPTKELWDALTENITNLRTRLDSLEPVTKDMGALRERVAVAEVRSLVPGPAGKDGANGANGLNGKDGVDGLGFDDLVTAQQDERSFTIKAVKGDRVKDIGTARFAVQLQRGVYIDGKSYEHGDVVTWGGSQWHANEETTTKPGDGSKAWTLTVKRGRDGKDGRDGHDLVPVVSVGSRA